MFDSECQKVNIGELLWSENLEAVDQAFVEKGYVIRPERRDRFRQSLISKEFERVQKPALNFGVSELRNHSHKSILCQRT